MLEPGDHAADRGERADRPVRAGGDTHEDAREGADGGRNESPERYLRGTAAITK